MIETQSCSTPSPEAKASVLPAQPSETVPTASICPRCGASFKPRSNKTYCTSTCAKAATRNRTRGPRVDASDDRYRNYRSFGRLHWLNETYYTTPPGARLGLLKGWLDAARAGNAHLAHVLTNPMFFAPADEKKKSVSFRGKRAYPPVPFLADMYCRKLLGCRVWQWTNGSAPEPETGELETTQRRKRPSGIRSETTNRGKMKETRTIYVSQNPEAFLDWLRAQRDPEEMKTAA
ncbi:hypothetical protein ACTTAI_06765 [Rhodobacter capsulatus]|uniref:hypothetical protein n=1 Tax=Rhodobacter capsulatus TaxID=1061 RepID=UPI0040297824